MTDKHHKIFNLAAKSPAFNIMNTDIPTTELYHEYLKAAKELEEFGLIELYKDGKVRITNLGSNVHRGSGLNKFIVKFYKKEQIKSNKEINDYLLSKWKKWAFWPLFIAAILSSFYSFYDYFIITPSTEKDVIELQQTITKMELDKSKQNASSLNQTFSDSLNH